MLGDRIVVIGPSGSGKSTLARAISRQHGHALLELDAVHWLPDWKEKPVDVTRHEIEAFIARERRWVIDGNFLRCRETIWTPADTIIWMDVPRTTLMTALILRTLRRLVTREPLWSGNRERWRDVLSTDPERSILAWGWTSYASYRADYAAAIHDQTWAHLQWIRIRNREEARVLVLRGRAD